MVTMPVSAEAGGELSFQFLPPVLFSLFSMVPSSSLTKPKQNNAPIGLLSALYP